MLATIRCGGKCSSVCPTTFKTIVNMIIIWINPSSNSFGTLLCHNVWTVLSAKNVLGICVGKCDVCCPDTGYRVCGWWLEDHCRNVQPIPTANIVHNNIGNRLCDSGFPATTTLHQYSRHIFIILVVSFSRLLYCLCIYLLFTWN